jgi:class 3 adenylate cyclase
MCEEERDMHGNVVFRGPKVKMGIYSGLPTRVLPHNTTGRADYFGPLVNRAARYCHAAARGGQVRAGVWDLRC